MNIDTTTLDELIQADKSCPIGNFELGEIEHKGKRIVISAHIVGDKDQHFTHGDKEMEPGLRVVC